jgi:hypothetical protein
VHPVGILSLPRNTLGWDSMRGQRGTIMPNRDKPFLFVLYIYSAEGALSYKKKNPPNCRKPNSRKSIKYIILHIQPCKQERV